MEYGCLVISLDFELFWGVRDKKSKETYGANILGAKVVIPEMIRLFEIYNVHTTFATVGLLFCKSKNEIEKYTPELQPNYINKKLSPYDTMYLNTLEAESDPYHSAYEIIEKLKKSKIIEIASHTFGHFYCYEKGQTIEEFDADIHSAVRIADDNSIKLKSIVLPRNQVSKEYINVCLKYGINTYRGNPENFFGENDGLKNKLLRLLDTYFPIVADTTFSYDTIREEHLFNIKASRFLKPYSPYFALFDKLKLIRIKNEMTHAAIQKKVYHLWWHPHNFGIYQNQNLYLLEEILKHFNLLSNKYDFKSHTMSELSKLLTV